MCYKAQEIQERWKISDGDRVGRVWWDGEKWNFEFAGFAELRWGGTGCRLIGAPHCYEFPVDVDGRPKGSYRDEFIWLPTQEQLQRMLPGNLCPAGYVCILYDFLFDSHTIEYAKQFSTMEELWLAFVMWRRHRKVWNDEKQDWGEGGLSVPS